MVIGLPTSLRVTAGHAHGPGSIADVADEWPGWQQVLETLTFRAGFNTNVVVIGTLLLGVAAGLVGVFALLRKRALMSDALSHATLPGIGLAFIVATWLGSEGRTLPVLLLGAAATGVAGVVCIQLLLRHTRLHEDAAIGIVLSVFFGVGIVLMSVIQSMETGTAAGINTFIYGQTAAMSVRDAVLMGAIALLAAVTTFALFKEFTLVCFNDAFANVAGWPVSVIDLLMMALVVLVTVAGLQAVGLILVVAMLIIPAVSARFWSDRLWLMVVLAAVIGGLSGYIGSVMSALLPRKPAGSVIVLTSGVLFIASMVFAPARGVLATLIRRFRLRLRIAGEHLVEAAFEHELEQNASGAAVPAARIDELTRRRAWPWWFRRFIVWRSRRRGLMRQNADGGLVLTERGRHSGARVNRNHHLWEQYLVSYADVAPSHVDWSVDQVEHVLSEELINELEAALAQRGIDVSDAEERHA